MFKGRVSILSCYRGKFLNKRTRKILKVCLIPEHPKFIFPITTSQIFILLIKFPQIFIETEMSYSSIPKISNLLFKMQLFVNNSMPTVSDIIGKINFII